MTADQARLAARREFGAIEPMKEAYRDRHGFRWIEEVGHDLRYGLRGLRRNPGFAVVAIATLAWASARTRRSSTSSMPCCSGRFRSPSAGAGDGLVAG